MDRFAVAAILLLALGLWLYPYLTGSDPTSDPSAQARLIEPRPLPNHPQAADLSNPLPVPPAELAPAPAQPLTFVEVRGQAGFWRLGRTSTGTWWFISPTGQPEFLNSVTTVQPWQLGRDKDGIHYVSRDFTGVPGGTGDLDAWAQKTVNRVFDAGFKALGAWSHTAFHNYNIPISRDLNVWAWMRPGHRRFYSPQWSVTAEHAIEQQTVPLRDNANLVGYFIDNELDWSDDAAGPAHYFDDLPADDPNRAEVIKVICSIWPDIDGFNRDWQVEISDFAELGTWPTLPRDCPAAYNRLFSAWLSHLAEDYFRLTCGLIRKYDPNHLILGVRFRGYAPREVVRASRGFTDAQSINYYASDALLDEEMFRMMHEESAQPVMVTEYSFHALDGRSGNRNTVGFAAQVLDQQARADAYRLFTTRAARVPFIVGVDWFQWSDEPPSGRSNDGEDVNFGIVDVDDNIYEPLAAAVKETGPMLNALHAGSITSHPSDVYRESFANKPTIHVPYLARPIVLNGELSDWSMEAKVQGIRHSQTIGLERSSLPVPNVFVGWRPEGLYLAIEVFDNDIYTAPADGWWWTRDHVEFWISTRPVSADANSYDPFCHQFFFVPNAWPGQDGILGTVGQWHRAGDALNDNLIPHPDIRNAVRIRPDRYVVEILIPAKTLNGWDPGSEPAMAFNVHVRNFQHAIDYFWSAPKEVRTQHRPGTWGPMYLLRAPGSDLAQAPTTLPAMPDPR